MFDVILMAVAAVLQLGVTIYSVDIAVREHRGKNATIIGVVGGLAIISTIWAGYDAYIVQDQLASDVASMKKQLSGAKVGLVRLNLIPPAQQLASPITVYMKFGVDEGTAKEMQCWFDAFTLPGDATDEQNRKARATFRQFVATAEPPHGEDRIAGSGCYIQWQVKISDSEIRELVEKKDGSASRILYATGLVKWKNEAGSEFQTEVCKWMDSPKSLLVNTPGWHDCS